MEGSLTLSALNGSAARPIFVLVSRKADLWVGIRRSLRSVDEGTAEGEWCAAAVFTNNEHRCHHSHFRM